MKTRRSPKPKPKPKPNQPRSNARHWALHGTLHATAASSGVDILFKRDGPASETRRPAAAAASTQQPPLGRGLPSASPGPPGPCRGTCAWRSTSTTARGPAGRGEGGRRVSGHRTDEERNGGASRGPGDPPWRACQSSGQCKCRPDASQAPAAPAGRTHAARLHGGGAVWTVSGGARPTRVAVAALGRRAA